MYNIPSSNWRYRIKGNRRSMTGQMMEERKRIVLVLRALSTNTIQLYSSSCGSANSRTCTNSKKGWSSTVATQYSIVAVHHGRLPLHRLRSTDKNKFVNGVRSRCWSWHSRRCNSRENRYSSMAKVHTAKGRRRSHELLQRRFRGQDGSHRSESYSGYQVCIILVDVSMF